MMADPDYLNTNGLQESKTYLGVPGSNHNFPSRRALSVDLGSYSFTCPRPPRPMSQVLRANPESTFKFAYNQWGTNATPIVSTDEIISGGRMVDTLQGPPTPLTQSFPCGSLFSDIGPDNSYERSAVDPFGSWKFQSSQSFPLSGSTAGKQGPQLQAAPQANHQMRWMARNSRPVSEDSCKQVFMAIDSPTSVPASPYPAEPFGSMKRHSNIIEQSQLLNFSHKEHPVEHAAIDQSKEVYPASCPSADELLEMAKDQNGCRILQRLLSDNEFIVPILSAVLPFLESIMMDPFGNYLCQKIVERCNEEQLNAMLLHASPHIVEISLNPYGTRAIQRLIRGITTDSQVRILEPALADAVLTLVCDNNGNHVIQTCLDFLGTMQCGFIYQAIAKNVARVGCHRHGCCVLQRCIDRADLSNRHLLVSSVISSCLELVGNPFGNYICQYVLDLKISKYTHAITTLLARSVARYSTGKFSSNVVEKALRCCDRGLRRVLIRELERPETLCQLIHDSYGNYVVQTALEVSQGTTEYDNLAAAVKSCLATIQSPYGRRVLSKLKSTQTASGKAAWEHSKTSS